MMTARKTLTALTLSLAALAAIPAISARAQDAFQEIESSKFQALGQINANAVYIRSGASDNDYVTMKVDRGSQVTVVGIKSDWLKILPPEGSYCYVAKAYVEKYGDGSMGHVTNVLNVRVGSSLNAMKTKVAAKLENGEPVKILGEQDEYFKIQPPKTVFLYVNRQFVDLIKNVTVVDASKPIAAEPPTGAAAANAAVAQVPAGTENAASVARGASPADPQPSPAVNSGGSWDAAPPAPTDAAGSAPIAIAPTTQPGETSDVATTATTRPADAQADAENAFDALEKTFLENEKKSIDQQPIAELQSGYEKLAAGGALPESLRRMCEYRLSIVKQRAEDQGKYIAVKKVQEEMREKQLALQAEREELQTRIEQSGVKYFAAVGTLRVSSLQQGGGTLYRLTDPKTGRTVVYVRTDDPKISAMVGQFLGIGGTVSVEPATRLKIVVPTGYEVVDQSKVGISIAAQVLPPSLMPSGIAGTGND